MKTWLAIALCVLSSTTAARAQAPAPVPALKNVLWIWLENTPYATLANQKWLKSVWQKYPSVRLSRMYPVSRVTQANTVAMISGSDQGIQDNELTRLMAPTVIDLLESRSIPWRVYAEDYPGSCYQGPGSGLYKRYRAPFISSARVQADRYLCSKIVSFRNYDEDLRLTQLPRFAVAIPNLKTSGANGIQDVEAGLRRLLQPILDSVEAMEQTTIVITTTNHTDAKKPELFAMVLGRGVAKPAQTDETQYTHYNVLRTLEDGLGLGHLNQNDSRVGPLTGFWAE